jgi:hypothetical protein
MIGFYLKTNLCGIIDVILAVILTGGGVLGSFFVVVVF